MNPRFKEITKLIQKFPGVGPRQAARFVLALLNKPEEELAELGNAITNLKNEIKFCPQCFNISDNPDASVGAPTEASGRFNLCNICRDPKRDQSKVLVVEKVTDLESIEKTGIYKGLYHVLGGAINPLDNVLPQNLTTRELERRIKDNPNKKIELILATNPSGPGETTALYLKDQFSNQPSVLITRLGRGLASGSHLEYADETTLRNALEYRK